MKLYEMVKQINGFYKVNFGRFGMGYGFTEEQAIKEIERVRKYQ